jgi:hypothetical protein
MSSPRKRGPRCVEREEKYGRHQLSLRMYAGQRYLFFTFKLLGSRFRGNDKLLFIFLRVLRVSISWARQNQRPPRNLRALCAKPFYYRQRLAGALT